jgi:hypothetical protein
MRKWKNVASAVAGCQFYTNLVAQHLVRSAQLQVHPSLYGLAHADVLVKPNARTGTRKFSNMSVPVADRPTLL